MENFNKNNSIKIIILGNNGLGKTSFVKRFINN